MKRSHYTITINTNVSYTQHLYFCTACRTPIMSYQGEIQSEAPVHVESLYPMVVQCSNSHCARRYNIIQYKTRPDGGSNDVNYTDKKTYIYIDAPETNKEKFFYCNACRNEVIRYNTEFIWQLGDTARIRTGEVICKNINCNRHYIFLGFMYMPADEDVKYI